MTRRHFGSVRRLPSGRWQAGYWHEGCRFNAEDTFPAKADALAYLARVETEIRRGAWLDPHAGRISITALAGRWLASNPAKRGGSLARDRSILRLHILPALGPRQIAAVTRSQVQELVNAWAAGGAAPRTVRRQFDTLRAMFTWAVDNELLLRSPCRGIHLMEIVPLRRAVPPPEAIAPLAGEMPAELGPMVWLGAVLGLRWGEAAGLRVRDLDLERGVVRIERQLTRGEAGEMIEGEPKSDAGRRTLTMPGALVELLAAHVEALGTAGRPDARLFAAPDGGLLNYSNWRRRTWLPAAAAAGVPSLGFHDLRRANATELVRLGVDLKTAQTRLGHSDPRLTLAVYAQAVEAADRAAAERLGDAFLVSIAHESRTPEREKKKAPEISGA